MTESRFSCHQPVFMASFPDLTNLQTPAGAAGAKYVHLIQNTSFIQSLQNLTLCVCVCVCMCVCADGSVQSFWAVECEMLEC